MTNILWKRYKRYFSFEVKFYTLHNHVAMLQTKLRRDLKCLQSHTCHRIISVSKKWLEYLKRGIKIVASELKCECRSHTRQCTFFLLENFKHWKVERRFYNKSLSQYIYQLLSRRIDLWLILIHLPATTFPLPFLHWIILK